MQSAALSGRNSARICDVTRVSIDFVHRFSFVLDINNPVVKFNHKCMHNHLRLNIPKCKSRGKIYIFMKSTICEICVQFQLPRASDKGRPTRDTPSPDTIFSVV